MKYTLNFQNRWKHVQLVRSGGMYSPLETELKIATLYQHQNSINDTDTDVPEISDFVVHDTTGEIIPNLSTGKRDKNSFNLSVTHVCRCTDSSEPYHGEFFGMHTFRECANQSAYISRVSGLRFLLLFESALFSHK